MTRESTLDEFLGGESDDERGDENGDRRDESDERGDENGDDPADGRAGTGAESVPGVPREADGAAAVTCEWTPEGTACEACGAAVERRWVDGDARVCADCKEW